MANDHVNSLTAKEFQQMGEENTSVGSGYRQHEQHFK